VVQLSTGDRPCRTLVEGKVIAVSGSNIDSKFLVQTLTMLRLHRALVFGSQNLKRRNLRDTNTNFGSVLDL
jgi:hypothetical protein